MRLSTPGHPHLTYCTNIHPRESWAEVRRNIEQHVVAVKARVCPNAPFGVGLRLGAEAAAEVEVDELRALLADHDLYVFTLNGFPYGRFHGAPVKEQVYRPDWTEPERLDYTLRLARLLAALLPEGMDGGSISTVPGTYRRRADPGQVAEQLLDCDRELGALEAETGKRIVLALEPEPACMLETSAEAARFFEAHLSGATHLAVCLDTCHAAVEHEEASASLAALDGRIAKIQLSAGLVVHGSKARLRSFDEPVYLHQVVARRRDGSLARFDDLPDAFAHAPEDAEWRVHFHVPIFLRELGGFRNTQPYLIDVLAAVRERAITPHLEVETYTWDVLPERDGTVVEAVAREVQWVLEQL